MSSHRDGNAQEPVYEDGSIILYHGDNREILKHLDEASVDAVVTDPPYELGFMGRKWDASGIAYDKYLWAEVWRVLKPGGHLLAFGGTRTWHRLACAIEDAGFEVRDSIAYMYGSGFPKSLDVSKAIDKAAGVERESKSWLQREREGVFVGDEPQSTSTSGNLQCPVCMKWKFAPDYCKCPRDNGPQSSAAQQWQGWGTAMKPAFEPIVVARKPLTGTVAENVQQWGTGALNIDGCRIGSQERPVMVRTSTEVPGSSMSGKSTGATCNGETTTAGRWPANVILDESQAAELDRQSGVLQSPKSYQRSVVGGWDGNDIYGGGKGIPTLDAVESYGDSGGASRFFYTAKADRRERPRVDGIAHPTVKPLDLMRYLVRLVTPPGGTVLEPFAGSGTTAEACLIEGFKCIAIEITDDYLPLIMQRINKPIEVTLL